MFANRDLASTMTYLDRKGFVFATAVGYASVGEEFINI